MVGLRDFPLIVPCLGWFHIIDPCCEPDVKQFLWHDPSVLVGSFKDWLFALCRWAKCLVGK